MSAPLFLANLGLTVAALLATIVAGRKGARVPHYALAVATLVLLGLAIWQAELFGRSYTFESLRLNVHLGFATASLLSVPGVIWTGLALARARGSRRAHQRWVAAFVVLTVLSVATAGWMFLSAEAKESAEAVVPSARSGALLGAGEERHRVGDLGVDTSAA